MKSFCILFLIICCLTASNGSPVYAQIPWPEKPTNLQALPEDTDIPTLRGIMFGFSNSLGVNCVFCHVAEDRNDFNTYDFSADDKQTKKTARIMWKMVNPPSGISVGAYPRK